MTVISLEVDESSLSYGETITKNMMIPKYRNIKNMYAGCKKVIIFVDYFSKF